MSIDNFIIKVRELDPSRIEKQSTYFTRVDAEVILRELAIYYGYQMGRVCGKRSLIYYAKALRLSLGDYTLVSKEDINNAMER